MDEKSPDAQHGEREGRRLQGLIGLLAVIALAGCAGPTPAEESPVASASPVQRTLLAIGDSIPLNAAGDCPGCTGFVESYADDLSTSTGETYVAVNRSRHDGAQTADILEELQSGSLDEQLAAADVVVVSAGFNDQPPYGDEGEACYAARLDTNADLFAAVIATTDECITTQTASTGDELTGVLRGVRERAPEASILALTAYNAWTGWSALDAADPEIAAAVNSTIAAGLMAWRTEVCDVARSVNAQCIDLLEAFNGPEGATAAGALLAADYTHPSQAGNDLIRELLAAD